MQIIIMVAALVVGTAIALCSAYVWMVVQIVPDEVIQRAVRRICTAMVMVGLMLVGCGGFMFGVILHKPLAPPLAMSVPA